MFPQSFFSSDVISRFYPFMRSILFQFDGETAHQLTIKALKYLSPLDKLPSFPENESVTVAGLRFPHAVGLAAGFDKNAEVADQMLGLGFAFVEVGTVTPFPQAGNPKPRLFRLTEDEAIINRMGFNNDGVDAMKVRLEKRKNQGRKGILGANIGANKDSTDRTKDYLTCFKTLYGLADYFTANVSSPNTAGLRNLQTSENLRSLFLPLFEERAKRDKAGQHTPIFLKIAPDLSAEEVQDIAKVALELKLDALIISNTTLSRPPLNSKFANESGGLSGKVLSHLSTDVLSQMKQLVGDSVPLIGVGGIRNEETAQDKQKAGASLIQVYSGLIYEGVDLIQKARHGFTKGAKSG